MVKRCEPPSRIVGLVEIGIHGRDEAYMFRCRGERADQGQGLKSAAAGTSAVAHFIATIADEIREKRKVEFTPFQQLDQT